MKCPQRQLLGAETDRWLPRAEQGGGGAGGRGVCVTEEYRVSLVGDEKVLELHRIANCTPL